MEFKTFVNHLMRLPAMVVRTGRRVIVRFLSWTPLQPLLFRVLENRPAALASHDAERIDRAERRHLQAIKMLATVRKMGVAIQVNVATQV
jgi:hypothetical protein